MPLDDVQLDSIDSITNSDEKVKEFLKVLGPLLGVKGNKKPDVRSLKKFIDFLGNNVVKNDRTSAKPVLNFLAKNLEQISEDYNDELQEIVLHARNKFYDQLVYFPGSVVKMIRLLADCYQADEDWRNAAKTMSSVDIDDQYIIPILSIYERFDWRIQTAELYLAMEDNTGATSHIQKARKLKRELPMSDQEARKLVLRYSTCYSRILDSERKFLQAAVSYMELSQTDRSLMTESDAQTSLENAVTCAVLEKAGGPRTRVLAMLYRDERCVQLSNFKILEKMHKDMMVSEKEMKTFEKQLQEHQKATLSGGLTVLQKAVYEHNMLAASKLYKNIAIEQLSKLLGVSDVQAEDLARIMIQESRMSATIDQVDGIIEFDDDSGILYKWDSNIQDLCMSINDIVDAIDENYPNTFVIP